MTTEPGWEHYRTFLAVVRERSLSGAGRVLGVAQPTIGRRVQALEQALGVALFTRSQLGLDATPAAVALVPYAETMASAASALRRAASGEAQELRGSVRITASEAIGTEVLPAALAAFRELHPGIAVELVISNRTQDLLRRDADIAIRNVRPTQGPLVTRKVGVLQVGLHAHPSYLRAHGTPHTVEQLREHPLIGFDKEASMVHSNVPIPITRELFSFRCDDEIVQYAALRAGFGIGVCQVALAKRDGLVRVLPDAVAFQLGVWVVMHRDLKTHRRLRTMFDHLVLHLQKHIASELALE